MSLFIYFYLIKFNASFFATTKQKSSHLSQKEELSISREIIIEFVLKSLKKKVPAHLHMRMGQESQIALCLLCPFRGTAHRFINRSARAVAQFNQHAGSSFRYLLFHPESPKQIIEWGKITSTCIPETATYVRSPV